MRYSTMLHTILAYRSVLQVLQSRRTRRYEVSRQPWDPMDPPEVGPRRSPGLSGPEEARWGQVQSCSPALRGALPLVPLGQGAGGKAEKRRSGRVGGILHTLDPYGPSISRSQTVSGSVRS